MMDGQANPIVRTLRRKNRHIYGVLKIASTDLLKCSPDWGHPEAINGLTVTLPDGDAGIAFKRTRG